MSQARRWLMAARPKTLGISVVPVVTGTALAWKATGVIHWLPALGALTGAVLIQIGTNLHNDAEDFERGADTPDRIGPPRASAQGWFTSADVKRAAHRCFFLAFLTGIYLAVTGGWPIIVIGLTSLAAGYAYTSGPRPIAYSPSGELFVFLFFGLAAVLGSLHLQQTTLTWDAFLVACAIGSLASAILLVNNYRDRNTDETAGKLTLTHYLGLRYTQHLYGLLVLAPFTLPLVPPVRALDIWPVLLALPPALLLIRQFLREFPGAGFNRILAQTALLQIIYASLLTMALLVG
ncbi:MAG: 1,4-dihydroxy-2-naphthoate polyprenyltransferase [Gammaproteobacteria bacterium]|nr:1,4-dihydroxy-2-naphthoate polyprenyltransferase [Gammaproteobacteria bacterium]